MQLSDMWKLLLARGGLPTDVITGRDGARLEAAAAVKKDHQWDVIYFREDGYTVAADFYLAPYVMTTCADGKQWVGKIYRGEPKPKPI